MHSREDMHGLSNENEQQCRSSNGTQDNWVFSMNKPMKKRCRTCGDDFEEYAQGPDVCSRCLIKAGKKAGGIK